MHKEARRWLEFAVEDFRAAIGVLEKEAGAPRHACWLAQQSAEKALKALLVLRQIPFPKTHDLDHLRLFLPNDCGLKHLAVDLSALSEWAVESRYPGDYPVAMIEDARGAIDASRLVLEAVEADFKSPD